MTQDSLTQENLQWFEYAMRWSMQQQQKEMQRHNLSHAKLHTLFYLYYHPGTRLMDLARLTEVSRAAASQLVEGMVNQDLILRHTSDQDKRNKSLALSEKGLSLVESFMENRVRWLKVLIASFDPEEAQLFGRLSTILNRKVHHLLTDDAVNKSEIETE